MSGFCVCHLVQMPVFLKLSLLSLSKGNPNIGVLKHREKYYSFSSKQAAHQFASKADEYIELISERAKRSPDLIQLLELHQQFASVTPYSQVSLVCDLRHILHLLSVKKIFQRITYVRKQTFLWHAVIGK